MNKKIIAVAILLLAFVVIFAACKKDKSDSGKTDDPSDSALVPSVDENGEMYVTNMDGDKIPVTTDADGFYDDISTLITATTNPNTEKDDEKTPAGNSGSQQGNNGQDTPDKDPTNAPEPSGDEIVIGSDVGGGSVDWADIPS